jgi:N-acetylglucosamine-6-phosphate deacetylase
MCSANGAKALGLFDKTGSITVGKAADIVIVDGNLDIKKVFVDGKTVR